MSLQPCTLAQDLLDHILDCVGDDPATLAGCALVCSDWTGRAQRNLFSRITLPCDALGSSPRRSQYDELVRTKPELALYTTHLDLKASWSSTGVYWEPHFASNLSHLSNVAQDVLKAFPSVEYLAFHDYIFAPLFHFGGDSTERWSPPESSESVM
ncbi:hypothetical protein C8Q74DRAFT_651441 [Fomes fomentarius]|nr:hypothetical protein C8Q74DRAFT_651441 [Fomes fomentarius]